MSNPTISNVAVVSRFDKFALASKVVIDGATISADGFIARGAVLVKNMGNGKWHVYAHGTDTLVADQVRILQDDLKVSAANDAFGSAWFEGFFKVSSLIDATPGLLAADLTASVGFHALESDEVRLK